MVDALLYAVRDAIRAAGFGYGAAECDITDDGRPHPRMGNVFVAVHGGIARPGPANERNLYELYGFAVTLTMRVTAPLDRIGTAQIARSVPLKDAAGVPLATRQGFNAKVDQLRALLHTNWGMTVLTSQSPASANDNLAAWASGTVYGFCRPALYRGPAAEPTLEGGQWMGADPDSDDFAIKAEMRFADAVRFQPQTAAAGVFT